MIFEHFKAKRPEISVLFLFITEEKSIFVLVRQFTNRNEWKFPNNGAIILGSAGS